jgi:NodT family efflux transporter outer membrane factor (OMF) lipoprotein
LWGSISRNVESSKSSAQASEALLQSTLLSTQATLVQTYLQLRATDLQQKLLDETVAGYQRSLEITRNQYEAGVASQLDVAQAQTQLEATTAQALDITITRQQQEHAIAILVGQAPAEFAITPTYALPGVTPIPISLPSTLLQRRPDIASAERKMAAANAQIGVAKTAFFPSISFGFNGGFQGNGVTTSNLFSVPNRVWSFGPTLDLGVLDGGARFAQMDYARAGYDSAVATYRQTVLSAFQEIEDNLVAIRQLDREQKSQGAAVMSAQKALDIAQNQYMHGTVSYLNVVTAQATLLNAQVTYNTILSRRLVAHAVLLKAMGGNWINQG